MSKKAKKTPGNFNYTPTTNLPRIDTIKTEWDLAALYYENEHDPRIEADIKKTEAAYKRFVKKWSTAPFTDNHTELHKALTEYETLQGSGDGSRPSRYFWMRTALNVNDEAAEKQLALLSRRFRKLSDSMLFFTLTLGALPKEKQTAILKDDTLKHFHYFLERVFLGAKHHLTEAEEKIINLKARQSYSMWTDMTEKIISNRMITYKGTSMALPQALVTIDTLKSAEKPKLWKLIMAEMQQIAEVAEHEFNAIITDVRTEDERRGYKKPYSATALGYEDTEKSIENLVATVSDKGFALSREFYAAKAKLNGTPLGYSQKYDSIGETATIPFEEAVAICRDTFYQVKPEYGEIFDRMLTNGQIDVFPRTGKQGGAFMSSAVGHPTQVFLNHQSNFQSLETLAHEMGHAIHSERSKVQSPLYEGHTITTAETASTLFENLVFDAVYRQSTDEQKLVLLHDRISRDISTIQRQIAFFNLELEIHETINKQGAMTKEELRAATEKHLKAYLGDGVTVEPEDGYSFVYIGHLRYGFYVYTYAFGLLMSTIMANRYKENPAYIEKIDTFLCSGQSDTVANIFKQIGINTTKPDTYAEALENMAADIKTFKKLIKKLEA